MMDTLGHVPEWMARAECTKHDPDMWFPERGTTGVTGLAKAICKMCPVATQCLALAIETDSEGIWAATDPGERKGLTRKASA